MMLLFYVTKSVQHFCIRHIYTMVTGQFADKPTHGLVNSPKYSIKNLQ